MQYKFSVYPGAQPFPITLTPCVASIYRDIFSHAFATPPLSACSAALKGSMSHPSKAICVL